MNHRLSLVEEEPDIALRFGQVQRPFQRLEGLVRADGAGDGQGAQGLDLDGTPQAVGRQGRGQQGVQELQCPGCIVPRQQDTGHDQVLHLAQVFGGGDLAILLGPAGGPLHLALGQPQVRLEGAGGTRDAVDFAGPGMLHGLGHGSLGASRVAPGLKDLGQLGMAKAETGRDAALAQLLQPGPHVALGCLELIPLIV